MNTIFLLMAEYETASIPLAVVAEKYLGMKAETAAVKATDGTLPIPTFRLADSNKSPRMVHLQDLAEHIDHQREIARQELKRCQLK